MNALAGGAVASRQAGPGTGLPGWPMDVLLLLAFALALRLVSYNGVFGSDDGTYFDRALDVATGTWSSADYNGALRYGFNLPAGILVWLFGPTPLVVNLWPLLCSLIEVVAVYAMATSILGRSAGLFAGLILAVAPIHMAVATRIHADSVVSMFITLSFVLLWFGWLRRSRGLLFACGLAIGGIFWAKELVGVTWAAFLPMLWLFRGRWYDALVVVAGVLLMMVLHGILMTLIAGHPLHLITTVLGAVKSSFIGGMKGEDAPSYYLRYLFLDLRHLGLMALLALAGIWFVRRTLIQRALPFDGYIYVWVWVLGLLVVLSILPVSLSPLRFVMKQSNYVTLFMGGIVVLAGVALASMPRRAAVLAAVAAAGLGLWLGLLQQADYRAFTAGSKALGEWVAGKPGVVVIGSTNNASLQNLYVNHLRPGQPQGRILSFRDLGERPDEVQKILASAPELYAAFDAQTSNWFMGRYAVTEPLPCWGAPVHQLAPQDLGLGNRVAGASAGLAAGLARLGVPAAGGAARMLDRLASPAPLQLYRVDAKDVLCQS